MTRAKLVGELVHPSGLGLSDLLRPYGVIFNLK